MKTKRFICLLMVLVMAFTIAPTTVFASRCNPCNGTGQVQEYQAGRGGEWILVTCPRCRGSGVDPVTPPGGSTPSNPGNNTPGNTNSDITMVRPGAVYTVPLNGGIDLRTNNPGVRSIWWEPKHSNPSTAQVQIGYLERGSNELVHISAAPGSTTGRLTIEHGTWEYGEPRGNIFIFYIDLVAADPPPATTPEPPPATTYTITFNANGGNVSPSSAQTGANGRLTSLPTPTRNGHTFNGWFTSASGGTRVTTTYVFTANATIFAQWTAAPVTPPPPAPTGDFMIEDGRLTDGSTVSILRKYTGSAAHVVIPDGVIIIADFAFQNNLALQSIIIPNSVTQIGFNAFAGTGLINVTIPNSVTLISSGAFNDCVNLTSITIPSSVTTMGGRTFDGSPVTIHGETSSRAESYAREYNIPFVVTGTQTPSAQNGTTIEIFIDNPVARVNGANVTLDQPAVTRNGRTVVPARFIAENLGATVEWDDIGRIVTITKGSTIILIQIDNPVARVNGIEVILDQPAVTLNGRTVVPARFIAENLGATVEWDEWARKVTITSGGATAASIPGGSTPETKTAASPQHYPGTSYRTYTDVTGVPLREIEEINGAPVYVYDFSSAGFNNYYNYLLSEGFTLTDTLKDGNVTGVTLVKGSDMIMLVYDSNTILVLIA